MITDSSGNKIESDKAKEQKEAEIQEAVDKNEENVGLQVARMRTGHLLLVMSEVANRRLGAMAYLKRLETAKIEQGIVGDAPEILAMYGEVAKIEAEVQGLVGVFNARFQDRDQIFADNNGVELYSDDEFFGRPLDMAPEGAKA